MQFKAPILDRGECSFHAMATSAVKNPLSNHCVGSFFTGLTLDLDVVAMTKMTVYARNGTSVAQTIYSLIIE